ncbi:hypothetical protein [Peribacillus loiseleuriae]
MNKNPSLKIVKKIAIVLKVELVTLLKQVWNRIHIFIWKKNGLNLYLN